MRAIALRAMAGLGLSFAACVSLSPEQEARSTLIWQAARECEARYRTVRVRHIDPINNIVYLDDYAQAEVQELMDCLNKRLRQQTSGADAPEEKPKGAYVPERDSVMPEGIGPSERRNLPF